MPKRDDDDRKRLRQRAEKRVVLSREDVASMSPDRVHELLHELQVHQIELELQNEELRNTQLELSETRDRYRDLYELAPVGYLTIDSGGKILDANLSAAAMLNADRTELLGSRLAAHFTPQSQDALHLHLRAVFSRPARQACELSMAMPDGTLRYLRVDSSAMDDAPEVCRTALSDVTDLRIAQDELAAMNQELESLVSDRTEELEASNETLREEQELNMAVIDTAPVIILVLDEQARIVRYNKYMEQLSGWDIEAVRGRDWFECFIPERDREQIREVFSDAMGGIRTKAYRNPIVTRAGSEREIEWYDRELRGSRSKVLGLLSIGLDVTDTIRAEEEIRHREMELTSMVRNATDAIVTHGSDGIITSFNPAAERMFGYSAEEVIGSNISILMPAPYSANHDGYIQEYLRTRKPRILGTLREMPAVRKDGSVFPIELSVNESIEVGVFTGFMRDISDRRSLQGQLLTIAEDEQRRIGQLLHDDVGQELTALMLIVEELRERVTDGRMPGVVEIDRIATAVDRTRRKARDLSHGLIPTTVDAGDLVSALDELAARMSEVGALQCSLEIDGMTEITSQFATQLYHIAQEALSNVVRHSGATRATIKLRQTESGLELTIRDNGIGIDPSRRDRPGAGLSIMQSRAGVIGADLSVGPVAEGGTLIACMVPVPKDGPAGQGDLHSVIF